MLVKNSNDDLAEIKRIAEFLVMLKPAKAYLAVPTRPPAERIEPPTEPLINAAYQILAEKLSGVDYLIVYEGNAFACTGNIQEDLLSITAVHPMREDAMADLLKRNGNSWEIVQDLIEKQDLVELACQGKKFYLRKLPGTVWHDPDRVSQKNK